jgi:monoamine oxidase
MKKKVYDVVIVGAGIAGLAAALEAKKRDLSFIVLDARDRVGGRIVFVVITPFHLRHIGIQMCGTTQKKIKKWKSSHCY